MTRFIEFTGGDVEAYLHAQEQKDLLRFITCGSVDDGKSTLIGRLLYEAKMLFEDQLTALEADSKKMGTQGGNLDFALLVDGLAAEREQGITIDVAYRAFTTDKRKFIVADTPGHEQYTRNMATGASTADLAIILMDARKGVLTQTRRHTFICTLLGIRHLVVAVNKMDLMGFDQEVFQRIEEDYRAFAKSLGADDDHGDPRLRPDGRQHDHALHQHAVVPRPHADGASRNRAGGRRSGGEAVPPARAVGEPPEPEFPRLLRHHRVGHGEAGRCHQGAALGPHLHRRARRHL